MRKVKKIGYVPAELEIIWLEQNDILTMSSGSEPGPGPGMGPEDDPNIDDNW